MTHNCKWHYCRRLLLVGPQRALRNQPSLCYRCIQNESVASMVARMEGILGPLPDWMVAQGRYAYRIFTRHGLVYERNPKTGLFEVLRPKRTTLAARLPAADEGMLDFIECLLHPDPNKRPSAEEALQHPWLAHQYPDSV